MTDAPKIPRHRHYASVTHETGFIARNGQLVKVKIKNKRFPFCKICGEVPTSEMSTPKPPIGKPLPAQESA